MSQQIPEPQLHVREQLVGHIVDWLQATFGWTDEEVAYKAILEERGRAKGPRPPLPFMTYNFTLTDLPNGMEEKFRQGSGYGITAGRRAVLSFVGYGEGSEEFLVRLGLATEPELIPGPLTILNLSPVMDVSEFDEDVIEARYVRDFTILYRIRTTEPVIAATWATTVTTNGQDFSP